MRLQLHDSPATLQSFLTRHDYPFHHDLALLKTSLILRLDLPSGQTAGFVWAMWSDEPGVLEFHACVAPEHRGRWLTALVIHDLMTMARISGARRLLAYLPPGEERERIYAFLCRRFGFEVTDSNTCQREVP